MSVKSPSLKSSPLVSPTLISTLLKHLRSVDSARGIEVQFEVQFEVFARMEIRSRLQQNRCFL